MQGSSSGSTPMCKKKPLITLVTFACGIARGGKQVDRLIDVQRRLQLLRVIGVDELEEVGGRRRAGWRWFMASAEALWQRLLILGHLTWASRGAEAENGCRCAAVQVR